MRPPEPISSATQTKVSEPDPKLVPDWVEDLVPLDRPLAVLDLEATGTAPHRDRNVEISVLKLLPDGTKQLRHRRLNPGMPIPPEATEVHGIHDEDVANEPEFRNVAASLAEFLQDCDLAGLGIVQFDLPMLRTEFDRSGIELVYVVWEDATELDVTAWAEHEEDFQYVPVTCKQVGFLLYDGPEGVVVTNGVIEDSTVARRNQIPRCMIKRIEWLTEPNSLTEVASE